MTKYFLMLVAAAGVVMGAIIYLDRRDKAAEERGKAEQIAINIAKANQYIAERRAKDATFNSMDAKQHCVDAGFEWVLSDGKSFCR